MLGPLCMVGTSIAEVVRTESDRLAGCVYQPCHHRTGPKKGSNNIQTTGHQAESATKSNKW